MPKSSAQISKDPPLIGAHMSAQGGAITAIERAEMLGIKTLQLFVKNNKQWFAQAALTIEEIRQFKLRREKWHAEGPVVAHACYLINFASSNPEIRARSEESYLQELTRAESLGVDQLVFHPGAHTGSGEEVGIANVIASLDRIHRKTEKFWIKSVIEITAGQGSSVGCTFEQLAAVINSVEARERMGICLDTCHMFAAGYDIRTQDTWNATFSLFEKIVGFEHLLSIHTNDSKKGLGSRVDRHAWLGEGELGLEAFRLLMNDPRFKQIPKILETPKDDKMTEDYINIDILKKLVGKAKVPPAIKAIWPKKKIELGVE
jgi:deoxyribonuclease-4